MLLSPLSSCTMAIFLWGEAHGFKRANFYNDGRTICPHVEVPPLQCSCRSSSYQPSGELPKPHLQSEERRLANQVYLSPL
jgi:hypothetical protein